MFGLSLTPWLLGGTAIAFVLATGAAGIYGHSKGYESAANEYQIKIDKMVIDAKERAQQAAQAMLIQSANASQGLETGNAKARIVYRTIHDQVDHLVEMPIYRNICFDAPGVQLANAALGNVAVTPPDPAKPDGGMPKSLTAQ